MKLIKPKFWDLKKPNLTAYILIPFTIFIKINNYFIKNYKKFRSKRIKTICVGNIYVGGTGKTPITIKLYNMLSKLNKKTVVIKKFYSSHNDEIKLLKNYTNLIFGNDRKKLVFEAIRKKFEIAIFDDGLQEKKVDYNLKFACFDSLKWIGNGKLLPAGPLRQNINVLKNVKSQNRKITAKIKSINSKIQVFNFSLRIRNKSEFNLSKKYLIFSGIGNSESFLDLLQKNNFKIKKNINYPDHYNYKDQDLNYIISQAKFLKTKILTTEKDYIKLPKKLLYKFKCIKTEVIINEKDKLLKFLRLKIND